jgi:hypothetical protein
LQKDAMTFEAERSRGGEEFISPNVLPPAIDVIQDSPAPWNWRLVAVYVATAILGLALL